MKRLTNAEKAELHKQLEEAEKAKFKPYENKIAELEKACGETQELLDKQIEATYKLDKENAELKEELKKWKDEWQEQVQKANDEGYARTLQTIQLTNAKEIIKELMSFSVQLCDCRHTVDFEKTREEAEQFISEVEK